MKSRCARCRLERARTQARSAAAGRARGLDHGAAPAAPDPAADLGHHT